MTFTSRQVVFVGQGMIRTAKSPAAIRAIVGPGYGVCVVDEKGLTAGLAHLHPMSASGDLNHVELQHELGQLIRAVRKEKPSGPLRATVIGGADVLMALPSAQRNALIDRDVKAIAAALAERDCVVHRIRTGGTRSRKIEIALPGGRISIHAPGKRGPRAPVMEEEVPLPLNRLSGNAVPQILVNMGCMVVHERPAKLGAILGSCVGIILFDEAAGLGGLAHVMLPHRNGNKGSDAKFAETAVPALVDAMVRRGAARERLRAKLVGGANVLGAPAGGPLSIGPRNSERAQQALTDAGIEICWQDLGGDVGRKVFVNLDDFEVEVKLLRGGERT